MPARRGAVGLYAVLSPCRATMPVGDRRSPLCVDERLLGDFREGLADDPEALRDHLGLGAEADPQEAFQLGSGARVPPAGSARSAGAR